MAHERRPRDKRDDRERGPRIPDEITGEELDRSVANELRTLPEELATLVARLLVAISMNLPDNPEDAWHFATVAKRKAGRVGVVREMVGTAAYYNGRYQEALNELRTARRMTGSDEFVPLMADCERGLGRPERAIELVRSVDTSKATEELATELIIVNAGARRDLDQPDAAVLLLEQGLKKYPESPRLRYAFADALAAVGRSDESQLWFEKAADVDVEGETDAAEVIGREDERVEWID